MSFELMSGKLVRVEIRRGGSVKGTALYPYEPETRNAFFDACRDIKDYAGENSGFVEFLARKINSIYGDGIAEFILDGQCRADELFRFLLETAKIFKNAREQLIEEYTSQDESEVMQ